MRGILGQRVQRFARQTILEQRIGLRQTIAAPTLDLAALQLRDIGELLHHLRLNRAAFGGFEIPGKQRGGADQRAGGGGDEELEVALRHLAVDSRSDYGWKPAPTLVTRVEGSQHNRPLGARNSTGPRPCPQHSLRARFSPTEFVALRAPA